jgi:large subunit ribosomal protein L22
MSVVVKLNGCRKSAFKVREVCNLIRNKSAEEALRILRFNEKKEIAILLTKLINSGLTIASNAEKFDLDNLKIGELLVDEGNTLKRIQPRAQGRAFRIRKRTSKIKLELKEG